MNESYHHAPYEDHELADDRHAVAAPEFADDRQHWIDQDDWYPIPGTEWQWGAPETNVVSYSPVQDDGIIGAPLEDMNHWHVQNYPDSCAIVAQEYILDGVLGYDVGEQELVQHASAAGWYFPGGGTPALQVGSLLELHGIEVSREENASFEHLTQTLEAGQKVLVSVDGDELIAPGIDPVRDDWIGDGYGIPGQDANHVVQVIGIDMTDPANPMVVLNDPGHASGCGMMVSVEKFMAAWEDSGRFMVHTTNLVDARSMAVTPHQPLLAGYYNADGTYHYDSDNTDRDPETGAIVRRW